VNKFCYVLILGTVSFLKINSAESLQVTILPYEDLPAMMNFVKKYLPEKESFNILEAGAYDGKETKHMSEKVWPNATIYSFEPVKELFDKLVEVTAYNKNIKCFNAALCNQTGNALFYLSEFGGNPGPISASSSLLPPKRHLEFSPVTFNKTTIVPIITIDDWAKANNVNKIDLFWLDTQGTELDIILASPDILKTVKVIITEVEIAELYEGQYLYPDVKTKLEELGFVMVARNFDIPEHYWFGDAIFVRKELL